MNGPPSMLTDLRLELRDARLRPIYAIATRARRVPSMPGFFEDIDTVGGYENLGQAIVMRLLTSRGDLAPLGHPEYGSRLHELIGSGNTPAARGLVKLHILEALAHEPRIEDESEVEVRTAAGTFDVVQVTLRVRPTGGTDVVTIGPFTLELTP